ncbi:hypothetical protein [Magnetospirillum sulfuroxidans]|uniref:Uncharacterized protein n=1 Tax=Magnetospirillum sulfuroxidans TaxID=611300 RepID=A0ABS5IGG6_9PROT|nr:hypothetical protein [Magnetospirillum sulfuroxidans]MBR9973528.1 hypothetical protein [Magnetospirillum sulfuroxidans]
MRSFLRLEAIVHTERHSALDAVTQSILTIGGWIIDHTLFSDVMAVVNFEFPADQSGRLIHTLACHGITASAIPPETIGTAETEIAAHLTLTFAQGSGDLRREVPAFQ